MNLFLIKVCGVLRVDQRQTPGQGDSKQAMKTDTHKVMSSLSPLHQLWGHVLYGTAERVGPVVLKQQHSDDICL